MSKSQSDQRVRSKRQRLGPQPFQPQLLYSRKQTARLLGYLSIDPILKLEQSGRLTPVRPTGKPTSQVFYRRVELEAIAAGQASADGRVRPQLRRGR